MKNLSNYVVKHSGYQVQLNSINLKAKTGLKKFKYYS